MIKSHPESLIEYDEVTARNVAEHLNKKYPGHLWAVQAHDGVVVVCNLMLAGNWGFLIKQQQIDNDYHAITRAGGELLERYNISRSKFNETEYHDLPRNFAGVPIGDKS